MSISVQPYVQNVEEARIIETAEMNLVVIFGAKLTIDGDHYCWLHGDNLQDGVAGFGKSPYLAVLDFNKNFHKELPSDPTRSEVTVELGELVDDLLSVAAEVRRQNWKNGGAHVYDDEDASRKIARALLDRFEIRRK